MPSSASFGGGGGVAANINGVPLIASGPNLWGASVGVSPYTATFDCALSDLGRLLSIPRNAATLTYTRGDGAVSWEQLSVIKSAPSEDQHIGRIMLVDRRYWWSYAYVYKFINRRRRVGTRRRGEFEELLQQNVIPQLEYALFSTENKKGKSWTPLKLLDWVIQEVDGQKPTIQDTATLRKMPLENVDLDHTGNEAVARVLRAIPGSEITIDPAGGVRVFSWLSGDERSVVGTGEIGVFGQMGPEVVGQGHVELIDAANIRPEHIDVLFTPEIEIRFDFLGKDPEPVRGSISEGVEVTPRHLANVLPCPDFKLTNPDNAKDPVYTGTYKTVDFFLRAWADTPDGALLNKLTKDVVNKAMIPERGLWAALNLLGQVDPKGARAQWSARLGALQTYYRRCFQIPKDWTDRALDMRPYLVATIDIASGQRAPAMVFGDYAYRNSDKGLYTSGKSDQAWAVNVKGFPGTITKEGVAKPGPVTPDLSPAPATLQILDADQGVIFLNYQADPFGLRDLIFPSNLDFAATKDRSKANRSRTCYFNAITKDGKVPKLADTQATSVFFTIVPATALYKLRVKPEDVAGMVPPAVRDGIKSALGPPMTVRVGAGIETARIQWTEIAKQDIEDAFFERGKSTFTDLLRPYCVNDTAGVKPFSETPEIAASLQNIASSKAAAVYGTLHDRVVGSVTGMYGDVGCQGSIHTINHSVNADGAILSSYQLRQDFEQFDIVAYMDPSTFRIVRRLAQ